MREWVTVGIVAVCVVTWSAPASSQLQTPSSPAPVVDYWMGDLAVSGQFQEDASLNFSGNNLNFDFGRTEPVNGTARIKVWIPEDGVVRIQIDNCVTALRPARAGVTLQTGGAFVPDYAHVGTPPNCGLSPGEVITKRSDTLTPTPEGLRYAYSSVNQRKQPKAGKATISGQTVLRPVYKLAPPPAVVPNAQMADAERRALAGGAPSSRSNSVAGSPRTLSDADLGDRRAMLPGDFVDGADLFTASGLAEDTIRNFVQSYLGDTIVFMPIRQQSGIGFQTRKEVNDYLVPFCAKTNAWCKAPFSTIDGAWVVRAGSLGISHYVYYHSDQIKSGVYCKLTENGFDCRPPPAWFAANQRMFLTDKNTYGIVDSVVPGYEDSPRRFATAQAISASNPNAACLAHSSVDSYVDTLTDTGRLVSSERTGTTYELKNICSYNVRIVVQAGAAGGCTQTWGGMISDFMLGDRQEFVLRPNDSRNIGACRGVITLAERE